MPFQSEFELLLRSRYPLLYIATAEEERLEKAITTCAKRLGSRAVYTWDFVDGLQGNPNVAGQAKRNPLQALEFVEKLNPNSPAIVILRDFPRFLSDVAISRKLRNLAKLLKARPQNLVITAAELEIPTELGEIITVVEFPLPDSGEIRSELERLVSATGQRIDEASLDNLVRTCQGLTLERIRRVLGRAIATHGKLDTDDLDLILEEKRQTIRQTQILDFYPDRKSVV